MRPSTVFLLICACFAIQPVSSATRSLPSGSGQRGLLQLGLPSWWSAWSYNDRNKNQRDRKDGESISQSAANTLGSTTNGHIGIGLTLNFGKNSETGLSHAASGNQIKGQSYTDGITNDDTINKKRQEESISKTKETHTASPSNRADTSPQSIEVPQTTDGVKNIAARVPVIIIDASAAHLRVGAPSTIKDTTRLAVAHPKVHADPRFSESENNDVKTIDIGGAENKDYNDPSRPPLFYTRVDFSEGDAISAVESKNYTKPQNLTPSESDDSTETGETPFPITESIGENYNSKNQENFVNDKFYTTSRHSSQQELLSDTSSELDSQNNRESKPISVTKDYQTDIAESQSSSAEESQSSSTVYTRPLIVDGSHSDASVSESSSHQPLSNPISEPTIPVKKDTSGSRVETTENQKNQNLQTMNLLRTHYYPVSSNFWYPHNGPYISYTTEYAPPPPRPLFYATNPYPETAAYNAPALYQNPYNIVTKPDFYNNQPEPFYNAPATKPPSAFGYNKYEDPYYNAYKPVTKPVYLTKGTTPYRGVTIYLESEPETTTQTTSTVYAANTVITEKPSINSWFRPPQFLTNIISVLNKDNVGKPRDRPENKPQPETKPQPPSR